MNKIFFACSATLLSAVLAGCVPGGNSSSSTVSSSSVSVSSSSVSSISSSSVAPVAFEIKSTNFSNDGILPAVYTCEGKKFGDGKSPSLTWTPGPEGTKSYAIAFKDMTVINSGMNVQNGYHWVIWNIPANVLSLPEGLSGERNPPAMQGAEQKSAGTNGFSFFGPCPSWNYCSNNVKSNDQYSFTIYAMSQAKVTPGSTVQNIDKYLSDNALKVTEVRGTSNAAPSCGAASSSSSSSSVPAIDGAALYQEKCSGCHGNGKKGATVARIRSAINANIAGMGQFSNLTDAQLQAISRL